MTEKSDKEKRERKRDESSRADKRPRPFRNWLKNFEDTMAAAAFAEAGAPEDAVAYLEEQAARRERVLLVVAGQRPADRPLKYAVDLSRRMNCVLTILQVQSESPPGTHNALEEALRDATDVPWQIKKVSGPFSQAVAGFLRECRRVTAVVMHEARRQHLDCRCGRSKKTCWWQHLGCPVVFIKETA